MRSATMTGSQMCARPKRAWTAMDSWPRWQRGALFSLMAYKDEYEVARLYTDGMFDQALADAFEGDVTISYHMAPPFLSPRDKVTGHLRKRRFGGWVKQVFRILAKGKKLRGGSLDIFGKSEERREERALIGEYEALLDDIVANLSADNRDKGGRACRVGPCSARLWPRQGSVCRPLSRAAACRQGGVCKCWIKFCRSQSGHNH